jgi:hypothetical protein
MKPEKVKFTVEELQQIIQQEISWCKNNPTGVDDVYRKGFINGLLQVETLVLLCATKIARDG